MKLKNRRPDRGRKLTASFALAMATVLISAVLADEPYQFIKTPGYDPAVYSTNTCSILSSTATSLTTGTLSFPAAGFDLVEAAHLACCASAVTIKKLKTTGTANRHELSYSLCEIQVRHEAKPDARARYGAGCSFRSPSVCENIKARHSVACARSVNVQTKGARRDGYVVSNKKIV